MKKNFFYALTGAIALTGALGFTACSSDNDAVVDNNPTFDGTSVRTDFAFSITKASGSQETRMTAGNVQESGTFRGMTDMYLLPFSTVPAAGGETNANNFPLGTLTTSDITSTVGDNTTTTSSKVYSLLLPLGTNNFLFYGKATNANSLTNFQVGKVTSSLTKDIKEVNDINFSLTSIVSENSLGNDATNIAAYLTAIANTTDWAGTVTTSATDGNYRALATLYTKFISNATPRAGSSEAVVRTVLDLYKSAKAINGTSSVTGVKAIADAICTQINTETSGVKVTVTDTDDDPVNWTAAISGANTVFPSNLDLPMGAAQLNWDGTKFVYLQDLSSFSGGVVTGYTNVINQYRYPAEIIYFDNSPLRATDQYKTIADYPKSAANWDLALGSGSGFTSDWNKTVVAPSTRAVAMQNNVNYGVAMLETKVQLKGGTDFTDNRAAILASDGETTNQNDIDGTQFKVTGLLIGGQPASVDWDMTNPDADFEEIIYDKDVQYGDYLSSSLSSPNYTIVFDNYATPDASGNQKNVLIALQIKNGDKDFYGYDGLIPAHGTFYLVGTLNPTAGTTGTTNYTKATRPESYRITQEGVQRVFMQDYKTVATIGLSNSHALKRAYSTIPDLRSTEIVFGLSVDLKWETGVQFNITIN